MDKKKTTIVFVLASIDAPHILKRIGEFIDRGYNVEVYGFKHFRETSLVLPDSFNINIIGEITQANYWKRISTLIRGVKYVIAKCKGKKVIYYLPSLDVAIFHLLFCKSPYIYEESDLKHTYVKSRFTQSILEFISKKIIKNAEVAAFTSEGFRKFHFGDNAPLNTCLVPNKLNASIRNLSQIVKKNIDLNHIRFAFVGKAQFASVYKFAEEIAKYYPQHEMHFYGTVDDRDIEVIDRLKKHSNIYFHGRFSNPKDLPGIYSSIDILLAIFDLKPSNWLYAEPNKLYDSIYFRTPIIAPKGTFLEDRVNEMGIGYSIDMLNESVKDFISSLSIESLNHKISNLNNIPLSYAVNDNYVLFEMIDNIKR